MTAAVPAPSWPSLPQGCVAAYGVGEQRIAIHLLANPVSELTAILALAPYLPSCSFSSGAVRPALMYLSIFSFHCFRTMVSYLIRTVPR